MLENEHFITTDIILIDIINFSKNSNTRQLEIANRLNTTCQKLLNLIADNARMSIGFIPTGDGFYIILDPKFRGYGIPIALSIKNVAPRLKRDIPYFDGLRIAVHTGELIEVRDINDNKNYIGNGLNKTARYMGVKIDQSSPFYSLGQLVVSEQAYANLEILNKSSQEVYDKFMELGVIKSEKLTFKDKHGFSHNGYAIKSDIEAIFTLKKSENSTHRENRSEYYDRHTIASEIKILERKIKISEILEEEQEIEAKIAHKKRELLFVKKKYKLMKISQNEHTHRSREIEKELRELELFFEEKRKENQENLGSLYTYVALLEKKLLDYKISKNREKGKNRSTRDVPYEVLQKYYSLKKKYNHKSAT